MYTITLTEPQLAALLDVVTDRNSRLVERDGHGAPSLREQDLDDAVRTLRRAEREQVG